ncbi:MAG: hypothetical protein Q8R08_01635 [bacterium]|nr:hypothetical protein [bacterium]
MGQSSVGGWINEAYAREQALAGNWRFELTAQTKLKLTRAFDPQESAVVFVRYLWDGSTLLLDRDGRPLVRVGIPVLGGEFSISSGNLELIEAHAESSFSG